MMSNQRSPASRKGLGVVCLLLFVIVLVVFGQASNYQFVNYDDGDYVFHNTRITPGLSAGGFVWAFTHVHSGNWHPLTTLSHMVDCSMYQLNPAGHHITNVALHAVSTVLLFLALFEMTGALSRSAFVAALFAIHPLRVESVVWISERKDVLSGVLFALTLWAYAKYTKNPPNWKRYAVVLISFVLGLLSKPILVTVPFVLLLLDYWPLKRVPQATPLDWRRMRFPLVEKIPFLVLSIAFCFVTVAVQKSAMNLIPNLSLQERVENAILSYGIYLWQTVMPFHLSVFYPHPAGRITLWPVVCSFLLLGGISIVSFVNLRARPWLLIGWCWYLGMLVPVIGIIQAGEQAHADRYTYLPQIGLWLMVVWSLSEVINRRIVSTRIAFSAACGAVVFFALVAVSQATVWRNSETLWSHTLACSSENSLAHCLLGSVFEDEGKLQEAIIEYQAALRIKPGYADALNNIGNCLVAEGKTAEAAQFYEEALKFESGAAKRCAITHDNLATLLSANGRFDEAVSHYRRATEIQPDFATAYMHWGGDLDRQGQWEEAIEKFRLSLKIDPTLASAHYFCGRAHAHQRRYADAVADYQEAIRLDPRLSEAHLAFGAALVSLGKPTEAIVQYQEANRLLEFRNPAALLMLADAYSAVNRIDDAIGASEHALELANSLGQSNWAEEARRATVEYSNRSKAARN